MGCVGGCQQALTHLYQVPETKDPSHREFPVRWPRCLSLMVLGTTAQPAPNQRAQYRGEMGLLFRDLVLLDAGSPHRPWRASYPTRPMDDP
jgi:hypothetical protein